jgi:hypothetical protein
LCLVVWARSLSRRVLPHGLLLLRVLLVLVLVLVLY